MMITLDKNGKTVVVDNGSMFVVEQKITKVKTSLEANNIEVLGIVDASNDDIVLSVNVDGKFTNKTLVKNESGEFELC